MKELDELIKLADGEYRSAGGSPVETSRRNGE